MSDFYFNGWVPEYGKPKEKFDRNAEAVRLAKQIQAENREATADEQKILANFIGWGDNRVNHWLSQLEGVMTDEEMRLARASSLNAHYTALPVVGGLWKALDRLGIFTRRIRALDPSAGPGTFKSATPEHLRDKIDWTEIELDGLTGQMLKLLHPGSRVLNVGFEKANLPDGMFDLAISNIPFGNYGVHTRKDMPSIAKRSIHEFFICNTWSLLRNGGIMAYITSRYTMDKKETVIRKWLAERFDLLGMVRLPSNSFTENAGTEVVTDAIILQKRPIRTATEDCCGPGNWIRTELFETEGYYSWQNEHYHINNYYVENPHMMLGKPTSNGTMYADRSFNLVAREGDNIAELMDKAFENIKPTVIVEDEAPIEVRIDEIVIREKEETSPVVTGLWQIYKAAKELIKAETHGYGTVNRLRKELNKVYDDFVGQYGLLQRHYQKIKGAEAYFLAALEPNGKKADIFKRSTVRKLTHLYKEASISDVLLLCLDSVGHVDLDWIASYKSIDKQEAIQQLGDAIYLEPNTMAWQTADQYLSGNVRKKYNDARAFSVYDEQFKRNVIALEAVLPRDVEMADIYVRLGAGWVPAEYIEQFIEHLADGGRVKVNYVEKLSTWTMDVKSYGQMSNITTKWGTARMHMYKLIEHALNSQTPKVWDGDDDKRYVNQTETVAAQDKLMEIKAEFSKWVWADEERAKHLHRLYNDEFNAVVPTRFNGAHLSTPGLTEIFKGKPFQLRINQKNLAWRMVQKQAVMGDHGVGAGKTAAAVTGVMESIRLGLVKKAMIVVPNHTMYGEDSWASTIVQLYPGANVLIPEPKDLEAKNRAVFMSTIATNNFDIVLVPFSSFKLLPPSDELVRAYTQEQIDELKDALEEAKGAKNGDKKVEKEIEKAIKRFEVKLEKLGDFKKDSTRTITFEELGIDMLVVDEFHGFKNLYFTTKMSRIAGLTNTESQRATDMFIKTQWLLKQGGKFVGLTGTVVTNTMAEMFTMMRFFMKAVLGTAGLGQFDAWARQFAIEEEGLEMTPDGAGFRMNTRFRKFVNLPEMMKMWLDVCDVFHVEDSDEIERPELYNGKPIKVLSDGGPDLKEFVNELAARAEKIKTGQVNPRDDNMLKITSEGRKAALDLSLVMPRSINGPMPKIDTLADVVHHIWKETSPLKGVQLIFCDLGTPKGKDEKKKEQKKLKAEEAKQMITTLVENGLIDDDYIEDAERMKDTAEEAKLNTTAYQSIKERLMKRGIPEEQIAFIHDYHTPTKKTALKKAVNAGEIRVLIGSNEKMGTGLNVQERAIAIHHLTPPWRPGDLEQQLGRVWRQGNKWPRVYQFVHVMQGSFDGYMWQTLENKAGFILQVKRGATELREMEDLGDGVLSFTEIKGLASGNPKVMQKIILDTELMRLRSIYQSWKNSLHSVRNKLRSKELWIEDAKSTIRFMEESLKIRDANKTEEFEIELMPKFGEKFERVTDKAVAGGRILLLAEQTAKLCNDTALDRVAIGRFLGHELLATSMTKHRLDVKEDKVDEVVPMVYFVLDGSMAPVEARGPEGVIRSIEAHMRLIPSNLEKLRKQFEDTIREMNAAELEVNKPWEHEERYRKLVEEVNVLDKELNPDKKEGEADGADMVKEAIAAKAVEIDNNEVELALESIRELVASHKTQAAFAVPVEVEPEPVVILDQPRKKPATAKRNNDAEEWRPAELPGFGEAVQLSLFGF